jgi:hypothetical protein
MIFLGPEIAQIIEEAIDGYMETKRQPELDSHLAKSLQQLLDFPLHPQLAKGLQQLLDVPDADAVEDTFCLYFARE